VARRDGPIDDGAELREYLRRDAEGFREMYGFTPEMWTELSKPITQLENGEPHRLHRWELPDWHLERGAGNPNDEFLLGADDRLTLR
jgi:hypothetical protein